VLLALYLRRAGHHIHYLGQNLPIADFIDELRRQRPAMVLFSASTNEAAVGLQKLGRELAALDTPRPMIGYGGRVFAQQPELKELVDGVYLGDSAVEAADAIRELL
jgi:methanogenic corrinoid protein MtbC1